MVTIMESPNCMLDNSRLNWGGMDGCEPGHTFIQATHRSLRALYTVRSAPQVSQAHPTAGLSEEMSYLYRTILCATAPTQTLPRSTPSYQPFSRHHADETNQILVVYAVEIIQRFPRSSQENNEKKNTNETDIIRYNGASHHAAIQQKQRV
jgi:hypothetical protein